MKRLALNLFLLALMSLLVPATALAEDALPEIKGLWVAESLVGQPLPEGASMSMDFIDASTVRATAVSPDGKKNEQEIRYTATKDGKLTLFPEPDKNPKGEPATWKIENGKLIITSSENETMVFKRPA